MIQASHAEREPRAAPSPAPALSRPARLYLACVIGIGSACLLEVLSQWRSDSGLRFSIYCLISVGASLLKVRLPGIRGTMSVNFLFFLVIITELSVTETLAIGFVCALAQTIWKSRSRVKVTQALFNLSIISSALRVSYDVFHLGLLSQWGVEYPLRLMLTACSYFIMNTVPVAVMIHLTENKPLLKTWYQTYFWTFSYYLVGAVFAWLFHSLGHSAGWQSAVVILPVTYAVYRSYNLYLQKLEAEKHQAEAERAHAEEVSGLHLRTIESLALAIEAKDQATHDHLKRVQVYSVELATLLGLPKREIQAIRAAAVLHDIGKLAVPEHIISKPGKLTREEFEKMKIHPVVGAEILEHVRFPYPVVPIVRHHHEKWDGSGYPDGLKGEEIPIGARVLSAVDCLDALASERQYRPAIPLDEAMEQVSKLSGTSYDPAVVEILKGNYRQWEEKARDADASGKRLSTGIQVSRGTPAAGLERAAAPSEPREGSRPVDFMERIAAARHEAQTLHEITQDMVSFLALDEMLSVVAVRLKKLIPFDTFAVYLRQGDELVPEFVVGDDFRAFTPLRIPSGQGLSGWVAENSQPILNGNPSAEMGYLNDPTRFSLLRSAIAVPLESGTGVLGTLALYGAEKEAFGQDHLRVLLLTASKLAQSIQNSLKYRRAEDTSLTDYLTGLPNARSLFLKLGEEVKACSASGSLLCLLVCDLDGFKYVNDRHGHLAGNRFLQAVGVRLKEELRSRDYVARMGGDEFVLLLRDIDPRACDLVARLTRAIEEVSKETLPDASISASIGYALAPEDGTQPEQLLSCADRRMYRAKEVNHKNRSMTLQLLAAASALHPPSTVVQ